MSPRSNNFPPPRARALAYLFLTLAFVFAAAQGAEAAGTFVSAPGRVDMVYDSARDTLYVTSGGSVLRYQVGAGSFLTPFNLGGSLAGLDLSPDGNTLVVADRTRDAAHVWVHVVNLTTGASARANFPRDFGEGGTFTVSYGGDGHVLITSTYEGSGWTPLRRLNPATGAWSALNHLLPYSHGELTQNVMLAASGDRSVIGFAEANISSGSWGSYNVPAGTLAHRTGYDNGTSWFNFEVGVNRNGTQYAIPTYGGTFIYNSAYARTNTLGVYAGAQPIGVVYHPVEDIVYFPWATTVEVRAFNTNTFAQTAAYNFEDTFQTTGNHAFRQGRMKMSRDGSLLFATVTGGVRFLRLYAPLAASEQSVTTAENTPVAVTLSGSVGNGGALSYRVATQPAHGTLSGTGADLTYTPEPNYEGADSFTFKSLYGPAESAPATVTINVTPGNNAPTADDQSVTADEDASAAVTLTGTDPEGSAVTYAVTSGPAYGTLSGTAPNLVYTPHPNYYGSDSFAFSVSDGAATSEVGHVYITVNGANDAPTVTDQVLTTDEDAPASFKLTATDIDSSPLSLTYIVSSPPAHGTLSGTGPNLVYTPNPNYSGFDNIGFKVNDGEADSNVSSVLIKVNSVNDAPTADAQSLAASEDAPSPVVLSGSDADGDAITYAVVTQPAHGTLSGTAPNLTYTPAANYSGPDSFTFRVNDGAVNSPAAAVSFAVGAVNDAPAADSKSVTTNEDTAATVALSGSDIDGDALGYVVVTQPAHGTLSGTAPNLVYTPAANYNGPDSFTFRANDGAADSPEATVNVTVKPVNDLPAPNDLTLTLDEDTTIPVTLSGTDVDGDAVTYYLATIPQHGGLGGTAPNYTYHPLPNYNGTDSFTYRANDGVGNPVMATVNITVNPVEDAPAADRQNLTGTEDKAMSIVLTGSDPDGDALAYSVTTAPRHGTLSGTAPNLVYTPAPNFYGYDDFAFSVSDGKSAPGTERVYITLNGVNDAPTAASQSETTNEDASKLIFLYYSDPDGTPSTVSIVSGPAHGTLTGTGTMLTYTPAPNYFGPDSFTFKANDGAADSNVASVQITVAPVNDAPVSNNLSVTTNEDAAASVVLSASDAEGEPVRYVIANYPAHGTLSGTAPNLTYRPAPNYFGPDSFTYVANDPSVQGPVATVTINVAAVNDAPVAVGDTGSVFRNASVSLSVVANDADVEGDNLIVVAVSQPPNGSVSIAAGGKSVTYTPKRNYRGNDAFTYTVSDGRGGTASASVNITVK